MKARDKNEKIYYFYALLFGRPFFYRANRFLFGLVIRGLGIYNYTNSRISGEKWVLNNVVKRFGDKLVVFDVGANVGAYTRDIIESGLRVREIYAFEPHPETFSKLCRNLSDAPHVKPNMIGVSDKEGEMTLYDREFSGGSSHASLSPAIFSEIHLTGTSSTKVAITTIDDFCKNNDIETIDFLKIDVEGFELAVLQGAEAMLRKSQIKSIQFEFTQLNSIVRVFFKDFFDLLAEEFRIYRLLPNGLVEIKKYDPTTCEIFGYQNFLATQKKLGDVSK